MRSIDGQRHLSKSKFRVLVSWCLAIAGFSLASFSHAEDIDLDDLQAFVKQKTGVSVVLAQDALIDGFYSTVLEDSSILYVSKDLKWVLIGDLLESESVDAPKLINHTEKLRDRIRLALVEDINQDEVVAFPPMFEETKAWVYVFTDTTCGFCRKMHSELNDYHDLGIEIRYLAYPRAGVDSEPYDDMVSAWCSTNPKMALTALKRGNSIESKTCENPVTNQLALGRQMGLRGTPLIVLPNGKKIGGYVPAAELAGILETEGLM